VREDGDDDVSVGDVGDDAPAPAARTCQDVLEVDATQQRGPVEARSDRLDDTGAEARARAVRLGVRGCCALGLTNMSSLISWSCR
jgi:hypothetical protein